MRHVENNNGGRPQLTVVGVHTASEAYPNTLYRLRALREIFEITEVDVPLFADEGLGARVTSGALRNGWRLLRCHGTALVRYIALPRPARAYVPYPAVFILWLWSLLPRRMRPLRIVADAFISIFDTVVNDRGLLPPHGWRARLLRTMERRAYAAADHVIVDTRQNAAFYARLFSLPEGRFTPIPLSTNEVDYRHVPYVPRGGPCRVLFVGTLIPLHGIETILAAAVHLQHRRDIRFAIVGDGQEAGRIQGALDAGLANLEWEKKWRDPEELAAGIADADVCLGVFGTGGKTQRVCPYKIYAYAAIGRAVITGTTAWLEEATATFGASAFASSTPGDAEGLAAEIARLADDPAARSRLAAESRRFYSETLDNGRAASAVKACLIAGETGADLAGDTA